MLSATEAAGPPLPRALAALLRADLTTQLRTGRALAITYVVPLALLVALSSGKRAALLGQVELRVALSLMLGMATNAIVGYPVRVAQDRELGIFQRLRVTPAPGWALMLSRLLVQVVGIVTMSILVMVVAALFIGLRLGPGAVALTLLAAVLGAAVFLAIGQALVGLVKSADMVSAISRVAFIPLVGLGLFGHSDLLGTTFEQVARWSPGGVMATVLGASMEPSTWAADTTWALLAALAYTLLFAGVGIRWFRWTAG